MRQIFRLKDYDIEVDYGRHVISRLMARFDGIDSDYLDYIFEMIFTDESVSDYLINDVRIGEDVVVIDEDSGISFAVNIGRDLFYIKTVYNAYDGNLRIGNMEKVLRFAKGNGLRVNVFGKSKEEVYA